MDHFIMKVVRNSADLEQARAIRQAVFVREQGIPAELEYDEDEARAQHVLCYRADTDTDTDTARAELRNSDSSRAPFSHADAHENTTLKAVATGRLIINDDHRGTLSRIAVLQDYRERGIGKKIVSTLEHMARERGVTYLSLQPHYYLEEFYGKMGYKKIPGRESNVAGHPLITMEKFLS